MGWGGAGGNPGHKDYLVTRETTTCVGINAQQAIRKFLSNCSYLKPPTFALLKQHPLENSSQLNRNNPRSQ